MSKQNLLIEIGTEELPPKSLKALSDAFTAGFAEEINKQGFSFSAALSFAAPRRLALTLQDCDWQQADSNVEKRGPAVSAAFDADGNPTKAALGWARGNGITIEQAQRLSTDKGEWLLHIAHVKGKCLQDVLENALHATLKKLPIPKPMRWGSSSAEFIRPVHTLCVMYGDKVIPLKLFGLSAANVVSGHRFHGEHRVTLTHADTYEATLQEQYVIANYAKRVAVIESQLATISAELGLQPDYDQSLLEEIASLVEWPVVLKASFESEFLSVPKEALIYTMKDDQKYVPLLNKDNELVSTFLFVSNIDSKDPEQVIAGNQKVIRPRLADAKFFFETDKKTTLAEKAQRLHTVLFQKELGTVAEKSERLQQISQMLCDSLGIDDSEAKRAASLCKADLMSNMVMEFPSVQGVMGKHYALHDGESHNVALAIEQQYLPKYSGDKLPDCEAGVVLALAEKLDTLIGIFGIGKIPKGDKDPFALRRSAIGLIRIMIEKQLNLSLGSVVDAVISIYGNKLSNKETHTQVLNFIVDRFKAYYQDQNIASDVVSAVMVQRPDTDTAIDFDARIHAVNAFKALESAESLASANKRVANILHKNSIDINDLAEINTSLFSDAQEQDLYDAYTQVKASVDEHITKLEYNSVLNSLTVLKEPLAAFFEHVMIMTDNEAVKSNRVALVGNIRKLFLTVADVSLLAK